MISKSRMQESIEEIFQLFKKRHILNSFTLESIQDVFEIGNEVFMKHNPEEIDKISRRKPTRAPDIFDDEPFSFERTFEIYKRLHNKYSEINPACIQNIFEINSQLAWESYRSRYNQYIMDIYDNYREDEYINYLAAIVLYDSKKFDEAMQCINLAIAQNSSSADYTHLKALCYMQQGEFDSARTYLYQALFLVELKHDIPPRLKGESDIYPNYPIEFHTSVDLIRGDLRKLDNVENVFHHEFLPLINTDNPKSF